jgi:hypothetical protein
MLLPLLTTLAFAAAPDTTHYVVMNHGRPAGEMSVVRDGDSTTVRFWYVDRNRGPRTETRYLFNAGGEVIRAENRGLTADFRLTDVTGGFTIVGDSVRFREGSGWRAERRPPGTFVRAGGTPFDDALLARHLLRQPSRQADIVRGGGVRLEVAAETTVTLGRQRVRARMVVLDGLGFSPTIVWLDDRDGVFASQASWFITVRRGAEAALPAFREMEKAFRARRSEELTRRIMPEAAPGGLVIRGGDVFDSERGVIRPRTTVVIAGDRITRSAPTMRSPCRRARV